MAWTGDPVWLADVLRAEGLAVVEHDGWRDRGHGDFRDIRGVICHHTAGGGSNDWRIVQNGRPDLPGPLAQLVLERDGTYRVIAAGVCWHAGRGSWPGWPTNDANFHTIGIEAVSRGDGTDWTPAQLDAYKRGCAAILRRIGRDADDCVGHREYSSEGKIDPTGIDMIAFRRDVQALIDHTPGPDEEDTMLDALIKNFRGTALKFRDLFWWMDKNTSETHEQMLGPDDGKGGFKGWGILGKSTVDPKRDNTVVEALAEVRNDVAEIKRALAGGK
ncbi:MULTISPECIES: peptidoglycan recognition protein family protein [Nocardia]|uniref:peptidoglycan recognition protein family protein n=1 Tax=Nocardia TaxID=1817 RepID=UPI0009EE6E31|nr:MULTISPECIES: N-acetylmuramoyl-L-alanine amidase [Nocardia]